MQIDITPQEAKLLLNILTNMKISAGTEESVHTSVSAFNLVNKINRAAQAEMVPVVPTAEGEVAPDEKAIQVKAATNGNGATPEQAPLRKRKSRQKPLASAAKKG